MNEFEFLVPARDGLIVRDPITKEPLPSSGAIKTMIGPEGRFWRRRIKVGDALIKQKPPAQSEAELPKNRKSR